MEWYIKKGTNQPEWFDKDPGDGYEKAPHIYWAGEDHGWVVLDYNSNNWTANFEDREDAVAFYDSPSNVSLFDGVNEMMDGFDIITLGAGTIRLGVRHGIKKIIKEGGELLIAKSTVQLLQEAAEKELRDAGKNVTKLAVNGLVGKAAERIIAELLTEQGFKVLGSNVAVRVAEGPTGLRFVDHLVQTPAGDIVAYEVKSGSATRNATQMGKDNIMETVGGKIVGKNAPDGYLGPLHEDKNGRGKDKIMENQKEIKRRLLEEIGTRIKDLDFRINLGRQGFYKKTPFGKYSFHLSFIPHKTDLDVTADVAIRFDSLEDLVHEHIQGLFYRKGETRNTFSFGSNLGHITGEGQLRWTLYGGSDVEGVSTQIVEKFLAVGLPYLERYSDLQLVFEVISTVNPEAQLLGGFPEGRARNAIGLAYLLGKEKEFHEIVNEMTNYLRPIPNSNIEMFLEFAKKLEDKFEEKAHYKTDNCLLNP